MVEGSPLGFWITDRQLLYKSKPAVKGKLGLIVFRGEASKRGRVERIRARKRGEIASNWQSERRRRVKRRKGGELKWKKGQNGKVFIFWVGVSVVVLVFRGPVWHCHQDRKVWKRDRMTARNKENLQRGWAAPFSNRYIFIRPSPLPFEQRQKLVSIWWSRRRNSISSRVRACLLSFHSCIHFFHSFLLYGRRKIEKWKKEKRDVVRRQKGE